MGEVYALPGGRGGVGGGDVWLGDAWCSKRDIGRKFGVSVRTVERWAEAGCPSAKVGVLRRFRAVEVTRWLTANGRLVVEGGGTTIRSPRRDGQRR